MLHQREAIGLPTEEEKDWMKIGRATPLVLLAALGLGITIPAYAASGDEAKEQTALQGAKFTLSQGISIAEQQTGGKAFDAGVDADTGKPRIIVETNGPKGVQTVIIDAQNGQVVGKHAGGEAD